MTLGYREYSQDDAAIRDIEHLKTEGVLPEDIYIFSDDSRRTNDLVKMANANKIGITDKGINSAISNLFNAKETVLRNQFEQVGFSRAEAEFLEQSVENHNVVVVIKNMPEGFSF